MLLTLVDYGESFVFITLGIASILALAVGLERTIVFRSNSNKETSRFIQELTDLVRKRDFKAAAELIAVSGANVYTRFSSFSIAHFRNAAWGLSELMSGKIIEERIILEKRLTILNTLGNNAPFIGLLGTVLGVIKAFH